VRLRVYRELHRRPYPALNRALFKKPFQKPFEKSRVSSSASISRFKHRSLKALMSAELRGQT
jgi:hypothetical protein